MGPTIRSAGFNRSSLLLLSLPLLLIGCGVTAPLDGPLAGPLAGPHLRGSVYGGQQPVSGATVQLYAAGISGYGTGATPLLTNPAVSGSNGSFSITGDYTCPSSTSQLYIIATGGNPGLTPAVDNPSLVLMAAVGSCSLYGGVLTLDPNLSIQVNEVSTVASVYALAGFMDPVTNQVGATSTNLTGITNAFNAVPNLIDISAGQALTTTPAGNGTVPQAEINSLADSIAPCINSTGTDSNCAALFAAATPSGSAAPGNTLQAIFAIATHPVSQVAAIYALAQPAAPFQPSLTAAPSSWVLPIVYTTDGSYYCSGMAIDAAGDAWIAYQNDPDFNQKASSLAELSPTGALLSGPAGYTGGGLNSPGVPAIDPAGNVWLANPNSKTISKFSSTGVPLSATGFAVPYDNQTVAIDGDGNAWLSNEEIDTNGNFLRTLPTGSAGGFANSIDNSGNVWIGQQFVGQFYHQINEGDILELDKNGSLLSPAGGYINVSTPPIVAIANDHAGDAWAMAFDAFSAIEEVASDGTFLSPGPGFDTAYIGGSGAVNIAIDGNGNAWLPGIYPSNYLAHAEMFEFDNNGNPLLGASGIPIPAGASAVAVDASGNVWGASNNIIELLGAATPVTTPLSVGVKNHTLATRP
jgi:hypothetical protein